MIAFSCRISWHSVQARWYAICKSTFVNQMQTFRLKIACLGGRTLKGLAHRTCNVKRFNYIHSLYALLTILDISNIQNTRSLCSFAENFQKIHWFVTIEMYLQFFESIMSPDLQQMHFISTMNFISWNQNAFHMHLFCLYSIGINIVNNVKVLIFYMQKSICATVCWK